jgi:hypothetical protein
MTSNSELFFQQIWKPRSFSIPAYHSRGKRMSHPSASVVFASSEKEIIHKRSKKNFWDHRVKKHRSNLATLSPSQRQQRKRTLLLHLGPNPRASSVPATSSSSAFAKEISAKLGVSYWLFFSRSSKLKPVFNLWQSNHELRPLGGTPVSLVFHRSSC